MQEEVTIFWTGGWDSTFRLLQLCEKDIVIQPIYVIDSGRHSKFKEMDTMKEILSIIRNSHMFKAEVSDICFVEKENILEKYANEEISLAYKELHEKYLLGSQYEWFALLCNALDIRIECGLEMSDRSKALIAINESGGRLCKYSNDASDERLCIDKNYGTEAIQLIFGNFILDNMK